LFYDDSFMISEAAVRRVYASYPISAAAAAAFLTYDRRTRGRPDSLTALGNQMLRDLRFGVDTNALRTALSPLFKY
jgi:hypothetical protein